MCLNAGGQFVCYAAAIVRHTSPVKTNYSAHSTLPLCSKDIISPVSYSESEGCTLTLLRHVFCFVFFKETLVSLVFKGLRCLPLSLS